MRRGSRRSLKSMCDNNCLAAIPILTISILLCPPMDVVIKQISSILFLLKLHHNRLYTSKLQPYETCLGLQKNIPPNPFLKLLHQNYRYLI